MSYDHQKMDIMIAPMADIATLGDPVLNTTIALPARWFIGYQPLLVRAVWACITIANTVAPTILTYKYRPTPGSASGEIVLGTLTIPINAPIGNMYYEKVAVEPTKCLPGGEIIVQSDGGGTAGQAAVGVFAEYSWDAPGNNSKMVAA